MYLKALMCTQRHRFRHKDRLLLTPLKSSERAGCGVLGRRAKRVARGEVSNGETVAYRRRRTELVAGGLPAANTFPAEQIWRRTMGKSIGIVGVFAFLLSVCISATAQTTAAR